MLIGQVHVTLSGLQALVTEYGRNVFLRGAMHGHVAGRRMSQSMEPEVGNACLCHGVFESRAATHRFGWVLFTREYQRGSEVTYTTELFQFIDHRLDQVQGSAFAVLGVFQFYGAAIQVHLFPAQTNQLTMSGTSRQCQDDQCIQTTVPTLPAGL